jgi:hypothetical protein
MFVFLFFSIIFCFILQNKSDLEEMFKLEICLNPKYVQIQICSDLKFVQIQKNSNVYLVKSGNRNLFK